MEWHLTPRGWEAAKREGERLTAPADRVLTCHCFDENPDLLNGVRRSLKMVWHCNDTERVRELVHRYGYSPPAGVTSTTSTSADGATPLPAQSAPGAGRAPRG
jgi:hypothetical protein